MSDCSSESSASQYSQCTQCFQLLSRASDLARHMELHMGADSKRHKCPFCKHTTRQLSNLNTHIRTHTKERPLKCPECEKTYADPSVVHRHRKRVHGYVPKYRAPRAKGNKGKSAKKVLRRMPVSKRSSSPSLYSASRHGRSSPSPAPSLASTSSSLLSGYESALSTSTSRSQSVKTETFYVGAHPYFSTTADLLPDSWTASFVPDVGPLPDMNSLFYGSSTSAHVDPTTCASGSSSCLGYDLPGHPQLAPNWHDVDINRAEQAQNGYSNAAMLFENMENHLFPQDGNDLSDSVLFNSLDSLRSDQHQHLYCSFPGLSPADPGLLSSGFDVFAAACMQ